MPVIPGGGGGVTLGIANQVQQSSQASTTQLSWRQMVGEVLQWNPDLPDTIAARFVNNAYRKILDYRRWYGLITRGQINIPQVYSTGTVSVTNGSTTVTGTGTSFVSQMQSCQFRVGFTSPIATIASITDPTHLELDMPWGGPSYSSAGYSIFRQIVSFGPNIKQLISVLNLQQGWRLALNIPKQAIDARDPWRSRIGFTTTLVSAAPSTDGQPQWELYPIPISLQAFPFVAYIQPPDLSDANPYPYAFIRSDLIVMRALPDALLFRGKESKYYDPLTARAKLMEAEQEMARMGAVDDGYWLQNVQWDYSGYPLMQMGSDYWQCHEDMSDI